MKEITFIIIGAFFFTMPYILHSLFKNNFNHNNKSNFSFADYISTFLKNIITSGVFISLIFLLKDLKTPEVFLQEKSFINQIIVKIILAFRPLLYSLLIYILVSKIFAPIVKKVNIQNDDDKHSPPNAELHPTDQDNALSQLSKREVEVAKLAAKGMTNLQIAEELYISSETVKRHLATIYSKIGINSRGELSDFLLYI